MKIIWHFKKETLSLEERIKIEETIKNFNKESIVCFAEDLEIIVLNNKEHENN